MSKRLTFEQFRNAIELRSLSAEELAGYVEFDPESAVPRLVFKADALLDDAGQDYNVDHAIYSFFQRPREERRNKDTGKVSVVAEGDSWFNLPQFIFLGPLQPFPPAIAERIERNSRFDMRNIAHWGHTIDEIRKKKKYLTVLKMDEPKYFMLCGGGNDLQIGLANGKFMQKYNSNRPHSKYLTENGLAGIDQISKAYGEILHEVTTQFPDISVLCHGYDYPRPHVGQGQYFGRHLRALGIPDRKMDGILKPIVNLLNKTIKAETAKFNKVQFINLRNSTKKYTWVDDMHPGWDAFRILAEKFENEMW
ncbi:MAG: SGNH/GDSL hydrolase family protein [Chloroflexi bacterium]|nr:SGNH/GDSL hydrolase family protein [Chloroflexota bacterium]